ncbi:xanthine dehydrogenase family protein molybdopterin-binding subunit [Sphingomonas oligophenolica]|uniref:Xanthine dehydrogenase family protein molybdopterin-binding subunit n=1 Tax=Sphingomonas oligophenolica TaxID=301154 RepID=A0A502CGR8_9SPHN|nr:xanthine dehydrogenase family protein molybdopterin-binding subunit [Sphingomonas oligophenolica]TPG10931.1 xanthine dehydrogenase family protein molybdopterin-binding subunit [Sphingomonas oligophenolica]
MLGLDKGDHVTLTMDEAHPVSLLDTGVQGVIGKPLSRVDGPDKVSGAATYAAEYALDDLAYGVLVGAAIGKGRVVSIDAAAAKAMPGVIDVVTDFDTFIRVSQQGGETEAPTQGVRDIEYFGEIIAIVVAETFEAARDAAERLPVEYERGDGVFAFSMDDARDGDLPTNIVPARTEQGDIDQAMRDAAVSVDVTYTTPSQNSAAMEPHASIATWEGDSLTLYGAYQMPTSDAQQLAESLGIAADKVRIIAHFIGGGFGSKLGIAPESVAAAVAAKRLGRPVKAVMMRQQVFDATVRRSNTSQRMRLAARADGTLIGIGHETTASNLSTEDFFEPAGISTHFLYAGDNRLVSHDLVRLNWLLSGSMRAPGEAVGLLGLECAVDELAMALDIDPIELRRINEPARDPEKDVDFSSRALMPALDTGAKRFGWEQRPVRPGTRREGEWLIGMGVAAAARANMLMETSAKVAIHPDGSVTVSSAMTDIGTGSYTILTQVAAEMLGVPMDRITMELGDTNDVPAAGSGGSWGACSSGSAIYLACEALRGKLARAMDVAEAALTLKDGRAIGDNRSTPIGDLVGDGIEAIGTIKPGEQEELFTQASYGAHFAEVAVNRVTGETRVRRMLGVFAAGRILNEKTARSQCLGGMTFGIGAALTEDLIHDTRTGKLVNRDLAEYHVPVNADVPQLEVVFLPERDIHANPIHAKGIGELGICGAGAAIANAIYNATAIRVRGFPITLDKLIAALPAV